MLGSPGRAEGGLVVPATRWAWAVIPAGRVMAVARGGWGCRGARKEAGVLGSGRADVSPPSAQGPFDTDDCASRHSINPYGNRESRILFSTWNLDHM